MSFTISGRFIGVVVAITALLFGGFRSGVITWGDATPTPANLTIVGTLDLTASPTPNVIATALEMTLTPEGQGQMETAFPTKSIINNLGDADKMRTILHEKVAKEFKNELVIAAITTGGGAHMCATAWWDKPGDQTVVTKEHMNMPLWQVWELGYIQTAEDIYRTTGKDPGVGGCQTALLIGTMEAAIPASYLIDINNFTITVGEARSWPTDTEIITANTVTVDIKVPWGVKSLLIEAGNEITVQSIFPSEMSANLIDFAKWLSSERQVNAYVWREYTALVDDAHNLAILDVEAPIINMRTGERSTEHLDILGSLGAQSVAEGDAKETIRRLVCEAAFEAGFTRNIPVQDEEGNSHELANCTVNINLVGPNPQSPNTYYKVNSIPEAFPAADDSAGWDAYIAQLEPVIQPEEFEAYNYDNAFAIFEWRLNGVNAGWKSLVPEELKPYIP